MMESKSHKGVREKAALPMVSVCVTIVFMIASLLGCSHGNNNDQSLPANSSEQQIFPKGEAGPATNFTRNAYNYGLLSNDSVYNTLVGNVYFEKGARSNWHIHPSGQILIILDGEGYHQIEGQPRQTMKKGDVVKCPPKAKHWHGATENSSLTQMYILPKTENGIVTWLEPVTDVQYKIHQLKQMEIIKLGSRHPSKSPKIGLPDQFVST